MSITMCQDDYISLSEDLFFELKENPVELEKRIVQKISELISTHVCFVDNGSMFPKQNHNQNTRTYSRYGNKSNSSTVAAYNRRYRSISYIDRIRREVLSLLNKVSTSNQKVIVDKVIKLVDINNVKDIVKMIVEKCVTQHTYISMFMTLLGKIKLDHNASHVIDDIIDTTISDYFNSFDERISFLGGTQANIEDYNKLCDYLKCKENLLLSNRAFITLIKHNLSTHKFQSYYTRMLDKQKHAQWNNNTSDVLARLMYDYFVISEQHNLISDFTKMLDDIGVSCMFDSKTKFIILDIMDLFDGKIKS